MTLYRPKGEPVEAYQLGSGEPEPEWVRGLKLPTYPGDWAIRHADAACRLLGVMPDFRFRASYEPVDGRSVSPASPVASGASSAAGGAPGGSQTTTGAGGWRPIETAPKDGTHVLLVGEQRPFDLVHVTGTLVFTGYLDGLDDAWCSTGSTWAGPFYTPTHWMPLPSPPSDVESLRIAVDGAHTQGGGIVTLSARDYDLRLPEDDS